MTNYSCNNETISNEISKKDERSNKEYRIIIPLGLRIRERTQRIFPYPPVSYHSVLVTFLATFFIVSEGSKDAITNPKRTAVRTLLENNCNTKISKALTPKVCHFSLI